MKIIGINGSARKNGTTHKMIESFLEGAKSNGAETELINLYDLNYKGCIGCLACKMPKGKSYGKCAVNDDLKEIFKKIEESDGLIFGSPIYFASETGALSSFLERLFFQYYRYEDSENSLFPKKVKTAFVYTMNITAEIFESIPWEKERMKLLENYAKRIFGDSETFYSFNTLQTTDYSNKNLYGVVALKIEYNKNEFPKDLQKAFEKGKKIAQ